MTFLDYQKPIPAKGKDQLFYYSEAETFQFRFWWERRSLWLRKIDYFECRDESKIKTIFAIFGSSRFCCEEKINEVSFENSLTNLMPSVQAKMEDTKPVVTDNYLQNRDKAIQTRFLENRSNPMPKSNSVKSPYKKFFELENV